MNVVLLAAIAIHASVSTAMSTARIGSIRDCGPPDAIARVTGSVKTDPVPVPGNMSVEFELQLLVDAPDNLAVKKVTTRIDDGLRVPCLDGAAGTCTLPVCFAIETFPNLVCPVFPPNLPCECPIRSGTFHSDSYIQFKEEWLTLPGGAAGDYVSRLEFTEGSAPNAAVVACGEVEFTLIEA